MLFAEERCSCAKQVALQECQRPQHTHLYPWNTNLHPVRLSAALSCSSQPCVTRLMPKPLAPFSRVAGHRECRWPSPRCTHRFHHTGLCRAPDTLQTKITRGALQLACALARVWHGAAQPR